MPAQEQTYARTGLTADGSDRLTAYLRSLPVRGLASETVAAAGETLWRQLQESLAGVTAPNCVPMDDGGLRFSWIQDGRYLDAEVACTGRYEWFFRDRAAGVTEDGEGTLDAPSSEFVSHLRALYS
jgi:hypothetical protein